MSNPRSRKSEKQPKGSGDRALRQATHPIVLRGEIEPVDPIDGQGRGLRILSYEILTDALPEPEHGGRRIEEILTPDERRQLFEQAQDDPQAAIPRLRELIEEFPDVPVLYNWLTVAYQVAEDEESAERTAELLYERYPRYLFGRLYLAQAALSAGDLTRFEAIFEKKFDLKLLYPERNAFHISEFLAFAAIMVEYYVRTDHFEAAVTLAEIMEEIAPDAPQTEMAQEILDDLDGLLLLEKMITQLAERASKPPRRRKKRKKT
jgi:tetratricopeptide (TPR) repeat protein